MNLTLHVWRQQNREDAGRFESYEARDVSPDMSFLEMLDIVNERLTAEGKEPITFEHDCREGICGACGFVINGIAHGKVPRATVCQTHMREYEGESEIWIEPFRAAAFPVMKDLMVDRSSFDRIIQAGGYVSVNTGSPQDGNTIPIEKRAADAAFDAATCIGCGACVAACPNAAGALFTSAKIAHLGLLPQGQPERMRRVRRMVETMDAEGFGNCTQHGECEAACPKGISIANIARMNRDYLMAAIEGDPPKVSGGEG